MIEVSIYEAQNKLEEIIERVLAGEEIIISEKGIQLVRFAPFDEESNNMKPVRNSERAEKTFGIADK